MDLMSVGVPVGYCTDGVASNNTMDILESMSFTACSQKQIAEDAAWFSSGAALHMAGPSSAAVLGMRGLIGELRVGSTRRPHPGRSVGLPCQPLHDIAAALVYPCSPATYVPPSSTGGSSSATGSCSPSIAISCSPSSHERPRWITDRSHGRTIQDYNAH